MIRRVTTVVVSVLGLSILMLAVGAIAGAVRQPDTPAATESTSPVPQQPGALMVGADVAASISALQTRLSTVPRTGRPGRPWAGCTPRKPG